MHRESGSIPVTLIPQLGIVRNDAKLPIPVREYDLVTQRLECLTVDQDVGGSNPLGVVCPATSTE